MMKRAGFMHINIHRHCRQPHDPGRRQTRLSTLEVGGMPEVERMANGTWGHPGRDLLSTQPSLEVFTSEDLHNSE